MVFMFKFLNVLWCFISNLFGINLGYFVCLVLDIKEMMWDEC